MSRQPELAPLPLEPERRCEEFTAHERRMLLSIARQAIISAVRGEKAAFAPPSPHLSQLRGVFTTLHRGGELRGCVGYVWPLFPLYHAVAETAVAAAINDLRFTPLMAHEVPGLQIELSVLSRLDRIDPDRIEIGKHGLVVSFAGHRGLLLPQVPVERGWDRETFLAQTCCKAGLSPDVWRQGAVVEAFTAEVFGEESAAN